MSNLKLAVIYYSMGGTNYQLAKWAAEGAKKADAEVKVLKVPELAPSSVIESNPVWKANVEATKDVPEATLDVLLQLLITSQFLWMTTTIVLSISGQVPSDQI